jgi:ATP-binding cassette subfamily B (MDR/TAP) protein 1
MQRDKEPLLENSNEVTSDGNKVTKNKVYDDSNKKDDKKETLVPFKKLFMYMEDSDKKYIYMGVFFAVATGFGMPSISLLLGNVTDAFDPYRNTPDQMLHEVRRIALIFTAIGLAVWVTSAFYFMIWITIGEKNAFQFRLAYFKSILNQDVGWFDVNKPEELPSRLSKECISIQGATGEKISTIILAFSMSIAGFIFALSTGWKYTLVVLATFPVIAVISSVMITVMMKSFQENMQAYAKSGGYAE